MIMKKYLFFAACLMVISITSCDNEGEAPQQQVQDEKNGGATDRHSDSDEQDSGQTAVRSLTLSDAQKTAVERNNEFAFSFFRKISALEELKGKSFVSSPISATYALGMLNTGSTGTTSTEITAMLGFNGGSRQDVNELCKLLIENVPSLDEQAVLKLADCVLFHQDIALKEPFLQDVRDYYHGEVFARDFNSSETVDFINDWCSRQTEGMIKHVIGELSAEQKVVLMNAVYFKAPWSGQFKAEDTREEAFTLDGGRQQTKAIMHRQDATFYAKNSHYSAIGLPYGNGKNWVMYVLLPNEGTTVDELLSSLTYDNWEKEKPLVTDEARMVDVKLPKFKIDSEIILNDVLKTMGSTSMFSSEKADFTPMTTSVDPLWVSLVKQLASIEVSEEGTEASAVTIAETAGSDIDSTSTPEMTKFHATRPFIYLIQEVSSHAIFFTGIYRGE